MSKSIKLDKLLNRLPKKLLLEYTINSCVKDGKLYNVRIFFNGAYKGLITFRRAVRNIVSKNKEYSLIRINSFVYIGTTKTINKIKEMMVESRKVS